MQSMIHRETVPIGALALAGALELPSDARGLVVFACCSRHPRPHDAFVAETLHGHGLATLVFDLFGPAEAAQSRARCDIDRLARDVAEALVWAQAHAATARLPLGVLGAGSGAAAALRAAAEQAGNVCAIVSRGGRPDLAGAAALARVDAAALLIVGGNDTAALEPSRDALRQLRGARRLEVVPGASRSFSEPGTLDAAAHLAGAWFANHLRSRRAA